MTSIFISQEKNISMFKHHIELKRQITGFVLTNHVNYSKRFCMLVNNHNNANFSVSTLFIN